MCVTGASPNTHVAVEIDTQGEHDGSVRYEISEPDWTGFAHRCVIERLPEHDSGDPATLRNFLQWGLGRYNSTKRLVVVWNHGSGFRVPLPTHRNIASDYSSSSSLNMPEVTWALAKAGLGPKNKLSLLGFDACLMCMLEVAHHFSNHVAYLVGSQALEPGDGWPYSHVLKAANRNPTPEALAAEIVEVYIEACKHDHPSFSATQSVIDLSKTKAAMDALHRFGSTLDADRVAIMRSVRRDVQSYHFSDYVDAIHLAQLATKYIADNGVRAAAVALEDAISNAVIANKTRGPRVANSHGASIWFPHRLSVYLDNRTRYLELRDVHKDHGWVKFLDAYHA